MPAILLLVIIVFFTILFFFRAYSSPKIHIVEKLRTKLDFFTIVMFLVTVEVVLFLPHLFTSHNWFNIDFKHYGEMGDTIGGIMGPFIAIIAAFLTFIAFWIQFDFNKLQTMNMKRERFENQLFGLLTTYGNITQNISVENVGNNKKAFHFLFNEYQTLFLLIRGIARKYNSNYDNNIISSMTISFIMSGHTSYTNQKIKDMYVPLLGSETVCKSIQLVGFIQKINAYEINTFKKCKELLLFRNYARTAFHDKKRIKWYWGMRTDLITYIKHVNMIIKYINDYTQDSDKKEREAYYNYLHTQMSEHEIGLLYGIFSSKRYCVFMEDSREFIEYLVDEKRLDSIYNFNKLFR